MNEPYSITTHNGKLTAFNPATGKHRTFAITTQPEDAKFAPGQRIVSLLVGSDNTSSYQSFGFVQPNGSVRLFRSKSDGVWPTYADMIVNPPKWEAKGVQYNFEGHCRVCNRLLTTPESVASGIGPTCEKKNQ